MLSLFRDWPWPIILKVLSLGIACKTLYVFYSEPSHTTEIDSPEPPLHDSHSSEPNSNDPNSSDEKSNDPNSSEEKSNDPNSSEEKSNELNSNEYNVLNMKINILYLELIKIQPQLEKIQTMLDSLTCNYTKSNSFGEDKKHKYNEIDTNSTELNFIESNVNQNIEINQIHDEIKTNTMVEDQDVEQSKENTVEQSKENPVEQSKENTVEQSKENPVEQSKENTVEQPNEGKVQETSDPVEMAYVEQTNETHMEQSNDTPKSDKTCSFILRSGQRKGQSCNSKVKGRHTYCGMHR
jgi:hypothetical protein